MRIDGNLTGLMAGTLASAAPSPSAKPAFALPSGRPAAQRDAAAARQAAPLATLDALLALQHDEDPTERRRRSARRGQDLLDALDGLKVALLGGKVSTAELRRIADRLAALPATSGDPDLDALVTQIEIRARVELAKLGQV